MLVAVLTGLGAAIGVPFVLSSQPSAPTAALDESPTELDEPPPGLIPTSTNVQSPTPMSTGGSATPARSPSPSPRLRPPTRRSRAPAPHRRPFEPLTIEAETGMTTGSAHIWDNYLGTSVDMVRNLGNWGGTPGTLTLNEIVFPNDAEYTITIYFVHPNDETTAAHSSPSPASRPSPSTSLSWTPIAVSSPRSRLPFRRERARSHSRTRPSHAPSIDKIIISRL